MLQSSLKHDEAQFLISMDFIPIFHALLAKIGFSLSALILAILGPRSYVHENLTLGLFFWSSLASKKYIFKLLIFKWAPHMVQY